MMKSQMIKKGIQWGIRIGCVVAVFAYAFFFYGHEKPAEENAKQPTASIEEKADTIAASMSPEDKAGQLLMVGCLLYTSPSPRDLSTSRMPSSA